MSLVARAFSASQSDLGCAGLAVAPPKRRRNGEKLLQLISLTTVRGGAAGPIHVIATNWMRHDDGAGYSA